ncbi:LytTR family DNA-binding domain-containing protein [Sphingopyxis sp. JAI128]|uniref:LytR/AlgR family response regulator transcription factor n=1 Tax=Sphingopyxis sp. JAI128 TaxID=2723066 RepID=UPI001621C582|nr:LytTR family DNA-binding domain-containing protein [Sphingopyxis sp. JAI128]MBB6424726.1 two-component system LytT family response regulator [Sphingopyxis sp. JAI128]
MKAQLKPICALVVDDEAPARRRLTDRLAKDCDIGQILEAENGLEAITLIQQAKPDMVFLDVQMPEIDGLGVIDAVGLDEMPLTVFVTAYDQFALKAFEADAADYLLKPFGNKRYERTMERVKKRLHEVRSSNSDGSGSFGPELLKLVAMRSRPGEIWDWIVIKSGENSRLIMTQDIDWVEAAGVYVKVHVGGEEFLYRSSLTAVASRLDPFRFVRIHRSSIVNLRSIELLERRSHGDVAVLLKNGAHLMLSRSYRTEVEARLGQNL